MTLPPADPVTIINEAPSFGAPFWAMLAGIGTALVAGGFLLWNERRKRKAEVKSKDRELRLKACVEFLGQDAEFFSHEAASIEQGLTATSAKLFYVQVLAQEDVFLLADKLFRATLDFRHGAEMHLVGFVNDDEYSTLVDWYHYRQRNYVNALRQNYGLRSLAKPIEPIGPMPDLDTIAANYRTAQPG